MRYNLWQLIEFILEKNATDSQIIASTSGISTGGGWVHSRQRIMTNDTFHAKTPNCWTGFRNVCEWKEYGNGMIK